MDSYDWKDEYAIGVSQIDEQHKKWLGILNQLHVAFKKNTQQKEMGNILEQLFEYTQYHFDTEEQMFAKHNYPNQEEHIKRHLSFIEKLKKLSNDYKAQKATLTYELMSVLRNWLLDHIQWEDKQYAPFLKDNIS